MFTRIADSWEPRFNEAALRQFGRDKERFTDALKRNKQDVINWDNVLMGWEQLYEQAGDEWRSTFVPLMKGVIETQAEQQSIAFGMQFDVRNLYAEAWFDAYTMDFSSGVMDTTGLTLNQLLQDAQREGWSIPETEDRLGLVFSQWMHGNLVPDNFEWFSQRMPAYRRSLIARTEIIRSSNAGIQGLYRQFGVEQKEWLATEDDRTCLWCLEMNGKLIPIGGTFWEQGQSMTVQMGQVVQSMTFNYEAVRFPPLHPGCRCCLLPWKESWAELGVGAPVELAPSIEGFPNRTPDWLDQESGINPSLTEIEDQALREYKGDAFSQVNEDLRMGGYSEWLIEGIDDEIEIVDVIDAAMAKSRLSSSVTVFRGAGYDDFEEIENLTGEIFTDDAFVSTSLKESIAHSHSDGVMMEIRVPAGTPALNMERWSAAGWKKGEEAELLLPRGSRFRVISDEIDEDEYERNMILELLL